MTVPPWMLLRLGLETTSYHGAADEDRLALMSASSVEAYRAMLVRIFGFESSVERAALRMKGLDPVFLEERARSRFLREDLRALGLSDIDIGAAAYAAGMTIESAAHALGWLFVLERQMLVSGLIRRQLEQVLGAKIQTATSYLSSPGERPGARFRRFAAGLSDAALRHPPKLIVAGAVDGFRAQRQWYAARPVRSASETTIRQPITRAATA